MSRQARRNAGFGVGPRSLGGAPAPWVLGLGLVLALGLAVGPLVPPPAPAEADTADAFSTQRALADVDLVAQQPRPIGSAGNEAARAAIVARLRALGLEPELQSTEVPDYFRIAAGPVAVTNIIARIPGSQSTAAVAMVGHYDSVPSTRGANDDASAVAIMLETARVVLSGERRRNDMIFVFTDGEEPAPRFGSTAFVEQHPWASEVGFVINLEAIGSGGPSMLIAVNGPASWVVEHYAAAVPHPVAFSYVTATNRLIGASTTDFAPFAARGIPGVELAYLHGSAIYHTPADSPDHVSTDTLSQQGAAASALARYVAGLDLNAARGSAGSAFFTVLAGWVVRYPAEWHLPLIVLTGVLLAVVAWRRRWLRGSLIAAATTVLAIVVAAVLALLAWTTVSALRPTMGILEGYLYLALLVALVFVVGTLVRRVAGRWVVTKPHVSGVVAVSAAIGLLAVLAAPDLGYPLVWPALVGALGLLAPARTLSGWWAAARLWIVAGVALVLLVPPIDTFYQLAQPRPGNPDSELTPIIVIPAALLVLLVEMIRCLWPAGQLSSEATL